MAIRRHLAALALARMLPWNRHSERRRLCVLYGVDISLSFPDSAKSPDNVSSGLFSYVPVR